MSIRIDFLRFTCLVAAALLGACTVAGGDDGAADADGAGDVRGVENVESASQALVLGSDPEMAAYFIAVNDTEIAQAELALTRAANPDVVAFAQVVITDHVRANHQVDALIQQLGITPLDNPLSAALTAQAAADSALLQGVMGAAFDRAYMDIQVRVHYQVLSQLQAQLVAQAPGVCLDAQWLIPELRASMLRATGAALTIRSAVSGGGYGPSGGYYGPSGGYYGASGSYYGTPPGRRWWW
jgi:putative membrane protein